MYRQNVGLMCRLVHCIFSSVLRLCGIYIDFQLACESAFKSLYMKVNVQCSPVQDGEVSVCCEGVGLSAEHRGAPGSFPALKHRDGASHSAGRRGGGAQVAQACLLEAGWGELGV
eukprot:COSAG02_NODE_279_length_25809_cov_21.674173_3_plen_115_part_00